MLGAESVSSSGDQAATDLSGRIESQANHIISRHIPEGEFQIIVEVEAASREVNLLPYVPETLDPLPLALMDIRELKPFIAKLNVQIFLASRFGSESRERLAELLKRKLPFDDARGDQITFDILGIEIERPLLRIPVKTCSRFGSIRSSVSEQSDGCMVLVV